MTKFTHKYLSEAFRFDAEAGLLHWRERPLAHFSDARAHSRWLTLFFGKPVGYLTSTGRLAVKIGGRSHLQHRIIWALVKNIDLDQVPEHLDHKDTNPLNNREDNLRPAEARQNMCNRGALANNKCGLKGVSWHKASGKWIAQIKINGKKTYLGIFSDPRQAHAAYAAAANDNHGDFARAA